jgi:hypothetical protein
MASAFGEDCFEVLCSAFGYRTDTPVVGTGRVFIAEARQPNASIAKRALASYSVVKAFDLAHSADRAEGAIPGESRWPDWDNRSLAIEVRGGLRLARWLAQRSRPVRRFASNPAHTDVLEHALHDQMVDAEARGVEHIHRGHLLRALVTPPAGGCAHLLESLGINRIVIVDEVERNGQLDSDGRPRTPRLNVLRKKGVLPRPGSWLIRSILMRSGRQTGILTGFGHPFMLAFQGELMTQAVRCGDDRVTTAHALLAIIRLAYELELEAAALPDEVAAVSTASCILSAHGVTYTRTADAIRVASHLEPELAAREVTRRIGSGLWTLMDPAWGATAVASFDAARTLTIEIGNACTGTTHLLAAILEPPDTAASVVLRSLGVDPDEVRAAARADLIAAT